MSEVTSAVIRHVAESIGTASAAQAQAARAAVAGAGAPILERLAAALGGAQHAPRPRAQRRLIVVAAGDHGVGDPGIAMGADHPTIIAAREIAAGTAALAQLARAARTPIVLIDAGAKEPTFMPASAVALGRGATRDLTREPAMTIVDATLGLEAGIALAMSLAEGPTRTEGSAPDPLALVALGALGVGAEVSAAALIASLTGHVPVGLGDPEAELAARRGAELVGASALELLAYFGGSETAVLAGLILGAASINVPVILDSYATGAAALVAARFAPAVTGYLIAAHSGSFVMPQILRYLALEPIFAVGLGHGEGSGAAMVLPLVDQVSELANAS
ncbi:MAG: nicotinate-nucleotide--dimethylbenzimidazole phosphoribosyltransferase [Deltaproteobacteria bacterium]